MYVCVCVIVVLKVIEMGYTRMRFHWKCTECTSVKSIMAIVGKGKINYGFGKKYT